MQGTRNDKVKKPVTKEHAIAFIISLALFVWLVMNLLSFSETAEYVFYPIGKVLEKIPFSRKIGFAWLFIIPLVYSFAFYFVVKFYLLASRQFQITTGVLIVFGLLLAVVFHDQTTHIDWTSRGLNPNRQGFNPQVVILSGTLNNGSYFEIRMRGVDYYYARKWNNPEWKVGTRFEMQLAIPNCAWRWGAHKGRMGSSGGGGSWFGAPEDIIPARRLWNGNNFIGAKTNELTANEPEWHVTEQFQKLEKVGLYLIPGRIIYSIGDSPQEIYTIKKVEFWNLPTTNWFWDLKKKYVDGKMLTNDLHEPGPVLRSR